MKKHHPEQADDEIYMGNARHSDVAKSSWITSRLGEKALMRDGRPIDERSELKPCPYPNPPPAPPGPEPTLTVLPPPADAPRPETARKLVAQVIRAGEDFEFYPTTSVIIGALIRDLGLYSDADHRSRHDVSTVLDIGAGNGKVLMALQKANEGRLTLHAIEKSTILCQQLDPEILIVGTDFEEQSLLSKQVDLIFSNPPYSQFEAWAEKIIRQGSGRIYLVIPERWERSVPIQDAIKFREAKFKILGNYDFERAEDRTTRAKVHLLRIELNHGRGDDAFERFFQEQFADLIGKFDATGKPKGEENGNSEDPERNGAGGRHRPFAQLVVGPNYPEALVSLYRAEMANVEKNYHLVSELDADLLREFDISPPRIMACLKTRLAGLRNDYWSELFSHLSSITDRLCSQSRKNLLETLQRHVYVDFTVSNICAVLIWVIKNANRYIDSQLIAVYGEMVEKCNVTLYKSNKRTFEDNNWRYNSDRPQPSHYALDYRIVSHRVGGIKCGYSFERGLEERAQIFLGDLLTISKNLGFNCRSVDNRLSYHGRDEWQPGKAEQFYFMNERNARELLYDVRAFKNGNIHLRLNQKFILALNVEHGRLKGWLRSGEEAARELDEPQAAQYFNSNAQLANGDPTLLLK